MKNRIVFIVLVVVLSFFSTKKLVYGQDVSSEINLLKVIFINMISLLNHLIFKNMNKKRK